MAENLNEDQILQARYAFSRADADTDGYCNIEELKVVFKELGQESTEEDIQRMCVEFCEETRKPNTLQFPELLYFVGKRVNEDQEDQDLKEAFEYFDRNGDKKISASELKEVLQESLKQHIAEDDLNVMLAQADTDGDGFISFDEFKSIMQ